MNPKLKTAQIAEICDRIRNPLAVIVCLMEKYSTDPIVKDKVVQQTSRISNYLKTLQNQTKEKVG